MRQKRRALPRALVASVKPLRFSMPLLLWTRAEAAGPVTAASEEARKPELPAGLPQEEGGTAPQLTADASQIVEPAFQLLRRRALLTAQTQTQLV